MKQIFKEVRKNLYRRYTRPESQDYAVGIVIAMLIGLAINICIKGGF